MVMNRLISICVLMFIIFVGLSISLTGGALNDDTYITLRYAKNFAESNSFTYNINYPTYSLTCPLWGIILGVFGLLSNEYVLGAQVLAFIFALVSARCIYLICQEAIGVEAACFAAGVFLLDPYVVGAVYNGTEMTLFVLLTLAFVRITVYTCESYWFSDSIAGILFAAMLLTRPEAVVIYFLVLGYLYFNRRLLDSVRQISILTVVAAIVVAPWIGYAYYMYSSIVPTSIILKSIDSSNRLPFSDIESIKNIMLMFLKSYSFHIIVIIGVTAIMPKLRKGSLVLKNAKLRKSCFSFMVVVGLMLFYIASLKEKAISSRYMVTISPFLNIATAQCVYDTVPTFTFTKRGKVLLSVLPFLLLTVLNIVALESRYSRSLAEDMPRVITGRWIATNISPESRIGNLGGAGAIAFFFKGDIFDYDLISKSGKDIEFAKKRRRGIIVPVREYLEIEPQYIVAYLGSKEFDEFGEIIYANDVYKVIKLVLNGRR
jgi:hypothetical protein